jgi:hypothetical protein
VSKAGPNSKMSPTKQEGVHLHDATREFPVADRLASATEGKSKILGPSAKRDFAKSVPRAYRPRLGYDARGFLAFSESAR